jgi:hypothetical protein
LNGDEGTLREAVEAVRAKCAAIIAADDMSRWGEHGRRFAASDILDVLNTALLAAHHTPTALGEDERTGGGANEGACWCGHAVRQHSVWGGCSGISGGVIKCLCGQSDVDVLNTPTAADQVTRARAVADEAAASEAMRARLNLAKAALVRTGYFTADQVSDDIAPRITEMHSALTTPP